MDKPRFPDYFFILTGLALSALLAGLSGLQVRSARASSSALMQALTQVFPTLLFLCLGVVLLWPVFYLTQRALGRTQELTWGEWLWGLAWLGALLFTTWIVWKGLGTIPEFLATAGFKHGVMIGYLLSILSLGGLAIVLYVVGLVRRVPSPWTHTFGLALLIWPLLPLALWWLLGLQLE